MGQPHCAPFSAPIIARLAQILGEEPGKIRAIDPLGGTARLLAAMPQNSDTTIIEIESEFVQEGWQWLFDHDVIGCGMAQNRTTAGAKFEYVCEDSIKVLARRKKTYTHLITSPSYGNRFKDVYNPTPGRECRSYAQSKGAPLTEGNGAAHGFWQADYWRIHKDVMRAAVDRLEIDGTAIINVSDFYETPQVYRPKGAPKPPKQPPKRVPVVSMWISMLGGLGLVLYGAEPIITRRYKYGENRHRTEHEMLLTFKKVS